MQEQIRKDLFNLADEEYREFQNKLCPGIDNIIGIRVPVLRKYAKELAKGDFREYLETAGGKYYEEIMLQGMVICLAKMNLEEKLRYAKTFVPKIDNWAVCDVFSGGLKIKDAELNILWDFMMPYLKSEKEFELRFAVDVMIDHYIIPQYIDRVISELDKIKSDKYYVQMVVAWAISICFVKFQDITMKYLVHNHLDDFTYNKAIQKIIESNRVDEKMKGYLKNMKRKQSKK